MSFLHLFLSLLPFLLIGVESQALEGCQSQCGGVEISYPFGFGEERCAKSNDFFVKCRENKPYIISYDRDYELVKIDIKQGEFIVLADYSSRCVSDRTDERALVNDSLIVENLAGTPFTYSKRNKLTVIGCATSVFLYDAEGNRTDTGCSSMCRSDLQQVRSGTCSGLGCCESSITKGHKNLKVKFITYYSEMEVEDVNPCSYAFLVEENEFKFNRSMLTEKVSRQARTVLDFAVDDCGKYSMKNSSLIGSCSCLLGYEGNPYIPEGCKDIDECKQGNHSCPEDSICINTPGSCICSTRTKTSFIAIISALSGGIFILLFAGSSFWFYKKSKKAQMKKLRKNYFNQNRRLLEQTLILQSHENITENTKFFTLKELEKATNKFDETRVIGEGGHGTVYKDEFINEVALLSRTYHKNVIKLLGCCLETEVPVLVYEYIFNGTLSDHLHIPDHSSSLCWDDRLRIATEVASSIVYLLSASSNTIFHRDLKSANILLDDKLTAKLSDFGASKSINSDQSHVTATHVQGTIGYLDPEYYQSGKLTEKSDVYSFGVILVELLTGKKPISRDNTLEGESFIITFIKLVRENQVDLIFDESIVEDSIKEELWVVARLAGDCLKLRGEERPTMKEVDATLEGLRKSKRKQTKCKDVAEKKKIRYLSNEIKSMVFRVSNEPSRAKPSFCL
ncbi:putative Kinase [Zostera marina]|uniref:Putative Kinase n=1 Tax=Zostera marina TaxID=29655 RepID=A0A0K9PFE7_ZOSMR|nr:putative Kinase [Zostera marina]